MPSQKAKGWRCDYERRLLEIWDAYREREIDNTVVHSADAPMDYIERRLARSVTGLVGTPDSGPAAPSRYKGGRKARQGPGMAMDDERRNAEGESSTESLVLDRVRLAGRELCAKPSLRSAISTSDVSSGSSTTIVGGSVRLLCYCLRLGSLLPSRCLLPGLLVLPPLERWQGGMGFACGSDCALSYQRGPLG